MKVKHLKIKRNKIIVKRQMHTYIRQMHTYIFKSKKQKKIRKIILQKNENEDTISIKIII